MATGKEIACVFFSYLGLIFWSFQLVPQCYNNYKNGSTGNLSLLMLILWVLWSPFFFGYALFKRLAIPYLIQPNLFATFGLLCMTQVLYYRHGIENRKVSKALLIFIGSMITLGVLNVSFYYISEASSNSPHSGVHWIPTMMGIIPVILIPIGFFPQFYDIYKDKGCRGVTPIFVICDMLGCLFSLLGLVLSTEVDYLSLGTFIGTFIFDLCLLISILVTKYIDKKNHMKLNDINLNEDIPESFSDNSKRNSMVIITEGNRFEHIYDNNDGKSFTTISNFSNKKDYEPSYIYPNYTNIKNVETNENNDTDTNNNSILNNV